MPFLASTTTLPGSIQVPFSAQNCSEVHKASHSVGGWQLFLPLAFSTQILLPRIEAQSALIPQGTYQYVC
jgi:hypothetical protein